MRMATKTPSIASSNDVASMQSSKKAAQILKTMNICNRKCNNHNSSSHENSQLAHANSKASSVSGSVPPNSSVQGTLSGEWDKHSSASSMDNRDSRSSSSEMKHGRRQHSSSSSSKISDKADAARNKT
ncbi:unnamed protein product [Ceratitis capitata]|uniref:(Mediterranean fruit fly) hypothetical protein n=1 Tax=Ceratitis capitata TaxID=7213 RepID=A0A811VG18_CERCA|nr:unnamed protein product [Ceratitis capitata]